MSNLGLYQTITRVIKALGGPTKAIVIASSAVAVAGYGIIRTAEAGVKVCVKKFKATVEANGPLPMEEDVYTVDSDFEHVAGRTLRKGDKYQVLDSDDDAILIKVLGDPDNPYFVSGELLAQNSDYFGHPGDI